MAKFEWDLTPLFKTKKDFYQAIEDLRKKLQEREKKQEVLLDSDSLFSLLEEKEKIEETSNRILLYGSLCFYQNVMDQETAEMKKQAETLENETKAIFKYFDKNILHLGKEKLNSFFQENKKLEKYHFYFDNLFRLQEHVPDKKDSEIIKNNLNQINKEQSQYNELLKNMVFSPINVKGKTEEIDASNFAKFLSSRDIDTRRDAYYSVNQAYLEKQDQFAMILSHIYGLRIQNAHLEGYASVLEKTLFEENIDKKVIDHLIEIVQEHLPLFQQYLKLKGEKLDNKQPHLYDFGVPLIEPKQKNYTLEEAEQILFAAFKPLGKEYVQAVETLIKDGHIDAEPRKEKHQAITFSWNTYSFLNFRGSYVDLKNLAHEIGHIVNYYFSKLKQPFLYEDSTIFCGEIASIVNEILLNHYLYEQAQTEEEKIFYLSKEIENYFTSVMKQTMYTELENRLYKRRNKEELSSSILSEEYARILKEYYGESIVYDEIAKIEWSRLGHLYRHSYYPYKYATGLLIASTVVQSLVEEKSLSEDEYIAFLSAGSNQYSIELLKQIKVDLMEEKGMEKGFSVLKEDMKKLTKIYRKNREGKRC